MSLTLTSLIHPTMIKKIRKAMYFAQKCQGHMMNGHNKRCYIQNAKGHNIMRLDWIGGREGYIVYGSESRNITKMVRNALASVVARDLLAPATPQAVVLGSGGTPKGLIKMLASKTSKALMVGLSAVALTACQSPGVVTVMSTFFSGLFS